MQNFWGQSTDKKKLADTQYIKNLKLSVDEERVIIDKYKSKLYDRNEIRKRKLQNPEMFNKDKYKNTDFCYMEPIKPGPKEHIMGLPGEML